MYIANSIRLGGTLSVIARALSTVVALTAATTFAGECPADKRVPDGHGQKMSTTAAKGVTDVVRASIDVSKEPAAIGGRQFRLRQLDVQPGGVVPWHSHGNRPALIYIVSGEVIEYASNCAVPITHKAGDVTPEKNGTQHWWQNPGSATAVILSADLFPLEIKHDEHMM